MANTKCYKYIYLKFNSMGITHYILKMVKFVNGPQNYDIDFIIVTFVLTIFCKILPMFHLL